MNTIEKIETLGGAAKYDVCASTSCSNAAAKRSSKGTERVGDLAAPGICHSFTPDGRCISLFKVLMTNSCIGDCKYCANNCEAKTRRAAFEADELKDAFLSLYHRNYVEGLFLSSAVAGGPDMTEERMIEVVEKLRLKENFQGYIHLKVMPGTNKDLIKRATELANRVSLNLEAPNRTRFQEITTTKDFGIDMIRRMRWIEDALDKRHSSGQTTQFVIGACAESDFEVLSTVDDLYRKISLKRSYFSAFMPVGGTPLESRKKTPLVRENRLYQCDFLMRKYDFDLNDFVFDENGFLDLRVDPKMAIALTDKESFPLDINGACYDELLKVPGIGPQSATRIIRMQKTGFQFSKLCELKNLGVAIKRAQQFITINGARQSSLCEFSVPAATQISKSLSPKSLSNFQNQNAAVAQRALC